jgi:hypothetical protein
VENITRARRRGLTSIVAFGLATSIILAFCSGAEASVWTITAHRSPGTAESYFVSLPDGRVVYFLGDFFDETDSSSLVIEFDDGDLLARFAIELSATVVPAELPLTSPYEWFSDRASLNGPLESTVGVAFEQTFLVPLTLIGQGSVSYEKTQEPTPSALTVGVTQEALGAAEFSRARPSCFMSPPTAEHRRATGRSLGLPAGSFPNLSGALLPSS